MRESIHKYFKVGTIQWMSYPKRDAMESLKAICKDDFSDGYHLNEQGAIKFSKFLANYLLENYKFTNKSQKIIDSWENLTAIAYEKYNM